VMLSPCEAQSKQQQNEERFKWRREKIKFLLSKIFSY